ncbi:MAG: GMP synthase subunit A [Candidatus Thermoplasmatota archaeon]|nr:GMP synthase subunit A [Candidatus Thermoplasmatota archaeon]
MKVYVIDNGGQWTHREWRVLRDLDVSCEIKSNESSVNDISDADGLVLSGGAPSIAYESFRLGNTSQFLDEMKVPILGICAGAQFMGMHYGSKVSPAIHPEFGKVEILMLEEDSLLKGLPKKFFAWESHNDEIKEAPPGFQLLASSETCKVQAMADRNKRRYALQFHPEVEHTQFGTSIFKNFLELCVP